MHATTTACALVGLEPVAVTVEAFVAGGLPGLYLVGLGDTAVMEAKERVRAALKHVGHALPPSRLTVNLAPGDLRKAGPAYDLPNQGELVLDFLHIQDVSLAENLR